MQRSDKYIMKWRERIFEWVRIIERRVNNYSKYIYLEIYAS